MIRPLRIAHRAIWFVLAIILPLIVILGLLVRHELPRNPEDAVRRAVSGVPR